MPGIRHRAIRKIALAIVMTAATTSLSIAAIEDDPQAASPPAQGETAAEFALQSIGGKEVSLRALTSEGPVVLLVLRGYPGYQCPICTRQVGEFLSRAKDFASAGSKVVMIYPGPSANLDDHAEQFISGKTLPDHFDLLIDPDYTFTNAYGLRWDAPRETAYPAAFVIGQDGVVRFAKVSQTHGGRASVGEVLGVLGKSD